MDRSIVFLKFGLANSSNEHLPSEQSAPTALSSALILSKIKAQSTDGNWYDGIIDLDQFVGNSDGLFEWGGVNFSHSAQNISLSHRHDGVWLEAESESWMADLESDKDSICLIELRMWMANWNIMNSVEGIRTAGTKS
ncbi:hypothetical protein EV426DRAFT_718526 [Tirmania nivea]|nr:hypothetical protein EV426DRAFT_718526 [Tirmania nivea]